MEGGDVVERTSIRLSSVPEDDVAEALSSDVTLTSLACTKKAHGKIRCHLRSLTDKVGFRLLPKPTPGVDTAFQFSAYRPSLFVT